MFPWKKILLLVALALTAAACGLKGPLYQPDAPGETVPAATDPAEPKKKDPASGAAPGEQSQPSVSPPDPDRPVIPPGR
jgi:predicted small lipoprotein YifL